MGPLAHCLLTHVSESVPISPLLSIYAALPLKMSPLISVYLRWSSHLTETSEFAAGSCIRPWWNYLESMEQGRSGADDSSSRGGSSTPVRVTKKRKKERKLYTHQIFSPKTLLELCTTAIRYEGNHKKRRESLSGVFLFLVINQYYFIDNCLTHVCLHKHLLITVILCFMSVNKQRYFISLWCNKNAKIPHMFVIKRLSVYSTWLFSKW